MISLKGDNKFDISLVWIKEVMTLKGDKCDNMVEYAL